MNSLSLNSKSTSKAFAGLAVALMLTTLSAQAGTCDAKMLDFQSWLQQNASNRIQARVSSHNSSGVVTYTETVLLKGVTTHGVITANLATDASGAQYFSNKTWAPQVQCPPGQICFNPNSYPFSPYKTRPLSLAISAAGGVTINPGTLLAPSFNATCSGALMYGIHTPPILPSSTRTLYTLTFTKYTIPPPPQ